MPPVKYGGIERVVFNLAESLVKQGHKVTLFASANSKTSARLVPCVDKALRVLPETANPRIHEAYMYHGLYEAMRVLNKEKFDIIHNHMGWPFFTLLDGLNTPVLTTLHNSLKPEYERSYEERHMYAFNKDMPLVSISYAQRKSTPRFNFIDTVYNGIRPERFKFSNKPGQYLAFLGRFSPEKGPEQAIRIAKKTGIPLVMAGKINDFEQKYFDKNIKPLIDGKFISFIGEVGHGQKVKLLKNAMALLSPLRWDEPFGLTNIEAMACGTPVISIRRGSAAEIIQDGKTGYLCKDVREMIKRVADIHLIDRAACRQRVEDHFTAMEMAERYVAVYQKLVAANKA